LRCARDGLGVPHSPDLFHRQRDLLKPVVLPMQVSDCPTRAQGEARSREKPCWPRAPESNGQHDLLKPVVLPMQVSDCPTRAQGEARSREKPCWPRAPESNGQYVAKQAA